MDELRVRGGRAWRQRPPPIAVVSGRNRRRSVPPRVGEEQLGWLRAELRAAAVVAEKVIVMAHVPMLREACSDSTVHKDPHAENSLSNLCCSSLSVSCIGALERGGGAQGAARGPRRCEARALGAPPTSRLPSTAAPVVDYDGGRRGGRRREYRAASRRIMTSTGHRSFVYSFLLHNSAPKLSLEFMPSCFSCTYASTRP